jgi:hypothetical protein|nr:MAG TPA_asm: hypothetical protein [Caudoviricetes sp.]
MAEQFVSKFDIGGQTIEVKDANARTTASTASTNASNALNKVLELEKLSRVEVGYVANTETISITTGTHDVT